MNLDKLGIKVRCKLDAIQDEVVLFTTFTGGWVAEVEKVKTVSGNLRIGNKTFCKNKEVRHEKELLFAHKWILRLLKVHKITYFLSMKVQQFKFSLHFGIL